MGLYTFISNSEYSAQGTAERNFANGVQCHNPWAIMGMQLFNIGLNEVTSGRLCHNGEENYSVNSETSNQEGFNKALKAFHNNQSKETADALTNAYKRFGENPPPSFEDAYSYIKANHSNLFKA